MSDANYSSRQLQALVTAKYLFPESGPGQGAVLCMKDGAYRMILEVGGKNLDAIPPMDREKITTIYGNMLLSLKPVFKLQVQIHTEILNPTPYIQQLQTRTSSQNTPEELKPFINQYQTVLKDVFAKHNLIRKRNFIVVPYQPSVAESNANSQSFIGKTLGIKIDRADKPLDDLEIVTATQQLDLRATHIENYLNEMGIWNNRKSEEEIRLLLQELYHPKHIPLGY